MARGGDTCTVTTLDDSGPGSLRECLTRDTNDDDPTPLTITFEVGGTIMAQSDFVIRQPYLTIDGLSAPEPGITIAKSGTGEDGEMRVATWPPNQTCAHDVLIQGIRFVGVWTGQSEDHLQNAATIAIDGEDLVLCMRNVVLNRITVDAAQDSGGDIWGSAQDVTVQYSAFLNSLHPNTYSHWPGGEPDQQRERISNHHNLYAYIHERGPQVRGDIRDSNFDQNIMHQWAAYGFGGGYSMRLRCRDGFCPQRINVMDNHFTSAGNNLDAGLIIGDVAGPGDDGPIADQVFMDGNRVPPENLDAGTAAQEFERQPDGEITIFPAAQLNTHVLPCIGAPHRTTAESDLFEEVGLQIESEQ